MSKKKKQDNDINLKMKRLYIDGKPTKYIVCSIGEVYSEKQHKFLKKHDNRGGYNSWF